MGENAKIGLILKFWAEHTILLSFFMGFRKIIKLLKSDDQNKSYGC